MPLRVKLLIFDAVVRSSLLYWAETWAMTKSHEQQLRHFQDQCLRRLLRRPPRFVQGSLWYPAHAELLALAGTADIVARSLVMQNITTVIVIVVEFRSKSI